MNQLRTVTKAEFDAFVLNYPHALAPDICAAYMPPTISLNDTACGKPWPHSIVARAFPDLERHWESVYQILED
jgi:hypothetical protein